MERLLALRHYNRIFGRRRHLPDPHVTHARGHRTRRTTMETTPPDYTKWTNADLIQRVTALESQLRAQNAAHIKQALTKPRKPPKKFDTSKYRTRLVAFKFAYLGRRYNGFEWHANNKTRLPTVEEELWKALTKTKLIFPDFKSSNEEEVCWDGCEYSKCGRTDKGVSAFGQVIGIRVRSNQPKPKRDEDLIVNQQATEDGGDVEADSHSSDASEIAWDSVKDELPYLQMLNRVLPSDIRMLAWCPHPPPNFSARYNCRERRYRYFFTNPAYPPLPNERRHGGDGGAWLDLDAMQQAAKKLEGLHDFRNFCNVDGGKQISDFRRRIYHASIEKVEADQSAGAFLQRTPFPNSATSPNGVATHGPSPQLYYFDVRGSAFLWHQVRRMVAVLFLVGQGYESPTVIDDLVDAEKYPGRPVYDMAADIPLVLWDCIFPDPSDTKADDHGIEANRGYDDAVQWHYIGDDVGSAGGAARNSTGIEDRKYGRLGIMEDLWTLWQKYKMNEHLAASLMDVVARQGNISSIGLSAEVRGAADTTDRVFEGTGEPRPVGKYIKLSQRACMESPDILNARYAARKGITPRAERDSTPADADE